MLQSALQTLSLPVTTADENGYTLLMAAASYGQLPVLQWVWQQQQQQQQESDSTTSNTFVNAVDQDGDSALHYATTVAAAEFLIQQAGIDVMIRNTSSGKTALESKQADLEEMMADEDEYDEDDEETKQLKQVIEYLSSQHQEHMEQ